MPYALASGFFRPGSREASAILQYLLDHGGRFLGLVRFAPHTGVTNPGYQTPGTDDVYGTNVARFLADNDQPDQLLLSLYGKLAAGMTEHLRLRRGLDGRPGQRAVLPLDAPAAEQRQQCLLPRDAPADARPRDHRRDGPAARPRARVLDAAGLARGRASRSPSAGCGRASGRSPTRSTRLPTRSTPRSTCPRDSPGRCGSACGCRPVSGSRRSRSTARRVRLRRRGDARPLTGLSGHLDIVVTRG